MLTIHRRLSETGRQVSLLFLLTGSRKLPSTKDIQANQRLSQPNLWEASKLLQWTPIITLSQLLLPPLFWAVCSVYKKLSNYFPKRLYHLMLPLAMYEGSSFSTSLAAFDVVSLFIIFLI